MLKRKIFITGGCGFIGVNLVKYLLDKGGYEITVYDNLSVGSRENLAKAIKDSKKKDAVNFVKGDILDKNKVFKHAKGHDNIVHLAAHTSVIDSLKEPETDFKINAIGTFNLLETARKNNIKNFIFASTNAALGEQVPPINESKVALPISVYGASKLAGESLCSVYSRSFGIKTISLRFANCYGLYSHHKTSVVAKFMKTIKEGKPVYIYGDGNQTRDFINSEDISNAIFLCINAKPSATGEVFQIGTQTQTRIKDLAMLIYEISGIAPNIVYRPARRGEIKRNYSCIKKAKKILGFNPRIRLKAGLKDLWIWFNQ